MGENDDKGAFKLIYTIKGLMREATQSFFIRIENNPPSRLYLSVHTIHLRIQ